MYEEIRIGSSAHTMQFIIGLPDEERREVHD